MTAKAEHLLRRRAHGLKRREFRQARGISLKTRSLRVGRHESILSEEENGERAITLEKIGDGGTDEIHATIASLNSMLPAEERYELKPASARKQCPNDVDALGDAMEAAQKAHAEHVRARANDGQVDRFEAATLVPLYERVAEKTIGTLNGLREIVCGPGLISTRPSEASANKFAL